MSSAVLLVVANRAVLALKKNVVRKVLQLSPAAFSSGEWGSGAGKGGGSGGAVRDAGGGFGKMEAAREGEYFKKLQRKQLLKLKQHIKEEIINHEQMIVQHQEAIERCTKRIKELRQQVEVQEDKPE